MSGQRRGGLRVWPGRAGDGDVAIAIAVASDHAHQQEAMQRSHDFVVEQTGRLRAGPIQWVTFHRDEAPRQLEMLGLTDVDGELEYLDQHPDSVLVVAAAVTDKPRRSRRRRR